MEYRISSFKKNEVLIKILGPLNRNAVHSVASFIKPFLNETSTRIILDVDGLEDEKEIFFQLGLINAFKKEIDQAGCRLTVKAGRDRVKKYLLATGLYKLFNIADSELMA